MNRMFIITILLVVLSSSCFSNNLELEGIYKQEGSYIGIKITSLELGYLIQQVFLSDDNEIISIFEWQSAFIKESNSQLHFYWHTGRYDDSLPDSNRIIVYDLEASGKSLAGKYYFPQEKGTLQVPVEFVKVSEE